MPLGQFSFRNVFVDMVGERVSFGGGLTFMVGLWLACQIPWCVVFGAGNVNFVGLLIGGTLICSNKGVRGSSIFVRGSEVRDLNVSVSSGKTSHIFSFGGGYLLVPNFISIRIRLQRPNFSCGRAVGSNATTTTETNCGTIYPVPGLGPIPSDVKGLGARLSVVGGSTIVSILPFTSVAGKEGNNNRYISFTTLGSCIINFSSSNYNIRDSSMVGRTVRGYTRVGTIVSTRYRMGRLLHNNCVRSNICYHARNRGNVYDRDR